MVDREGKIGRRLNPVKAFLPLLFGRGSLFVYFTI